MTWTRTQPWVRADPWWTQPGPAPTPAWRTLRIPPETRIDHEEAA